MILQTTDFLSGELRISQDENTRATLASFITADKEKALIYELMGSTLGQAFLDDLTGDPSVPQSAKWTLIFNPFYYDISDIPVNCNGLKEYLKGRIYYDFVQFQATVNQASGNVVNASEATSPEGIFKKADVMYNRAISTSYEIQYYLSIDSTTYPDFKGVETQFISPI